MHAQNFNFACKFFQNRGFSTKFCILNHNFLTRKKFPAIFRSSKFREEGNQSPTSTGHDAIKAHTPTKQRIQVSETWAESSHFVMPRCSSSYVPTVRLHSLRPSLHDEAGSSSTRYTLIELASNLR